MTVIFTDQLCPWGGPGDFEVMLKDFGFTELLLEFLSLLKLFKHLTSTEIETAGFETGWHSIPEVPSSGSLGPRDFLASFTYCASDIRKYPESGLIIYRTSKSLLGNLKKYIYKNMD